MFQKFRSSYDDENQTVGGQNRTRCGEAVSDDGDGDSPGDRRVWAAWGAACAASGGTWNSF